MAGAHQIESVVVDPEAVLGGDGDGQRSHVLLDPRRDVDVHHRSARGADEVVVMVPGEVFGEFEPGGVVVGHEAVHHTCVLEHGQVAVRRTLGHSVDGVDQLDDRDRTPRDRQRIDE